MKRLLLIAIASLLAFVAQAQEDTLAYHPFVQPGKTWHLYAFSIEHQHRTIDYSFGAEDAVVTIDGKDYLRMKASLSDEGIQDCGLYREENRKVYFYDEKARREYLLYDFTLKQGDRFEPEYGDFSKCEVIQLKLIQVNGEWLRELTIEGNNRNSDVAVRSRTTWVEGIGAYNGPLEGVRDASLVDPYWMYKLAYVISPDDLFLPFEFQTYHDGWFGQQLVKHGEADWEDINPDWTDMLQYELLPDPDNGALTLHVYGYMKVQCGPNNYVYCRVDGGKVSLQVEEVAPAADCMSWCKVDLLFPYFQAGKSYTAVDSRGEHAIQAVTDYRPFIEEGKVWKIGWIRTGLHGQDEDAMRKARRLEYYYFDGDTIVGLTPCKKWMCREVNEAGGETRYKAAVFEADRRVFYALPGRDEFALLYDFNLTYGDTISLSESYALMRGIDKSYQCALVKQQAVETASYKGIVHTITPHADEPFRSDYALIEWRQGVGFMGPYNLTSTQTGGFPVLMSCMVGDEVIFQDDQWIDDVTNNSDVKKQWMDFTHTIKTRPKAPRRDGQQPAAGDEAQEYLTGEYSAKELLVSLKPLSGNYTVTLRNASDQVVYAHQVQASTIVALSTDLSKYPDGLYTLVVENADEAYTAQLNIGEGDGIKAVEDGRWFAAEGSRPMAHSGSVAEPPSLYDLSGRRLSTPPSRGIYIRAGRKVVR